MPATRIVVPAKARKGEVIEIKTLIHHVMETGFRRDNTGKAIPRNIITRFTCTYGGEEVFRMDLFTGIAANPFVAFTTLGCRFTAVAQPRRSHPKLPRRAHRHRDRRAGVRMDRPARGRHARAGAADRDVAGICGSDAPTGR